MSTKNSILAGFLFLSFSIFAQDSDSFKDKEFSLFVGQSSTNIINDNLKSDKYAKTSGANWFNLGFNYCKYFNKNLGFLIGLEYSGYKNITEYRGAFWSESTQIDRDGYIYYAVADANYTHTRTVHTGEVPIQLRIQAPVNSSVQFFIDAGFKINFVGSAKNKQEGTFKNKGAYPHTSFDNVYFLIEDEAYYGYKSYKYDKTLSMEPARVNLAYVLGFGIKAKVSDKAFMLFNPAYTMGITDLVSKNNRPDYVDVFGEKKAHSKYLLRQFAIRFGVGFYL